MDEKGGIEEIRLEDWVREVIGRVVGEDVISPGNGNIDAVMGDGKE